MVLDEFQLCHRGPLRGFPSLLQAQVDRLQDRSTAGGLIVLGSVQAEMEALLNDRQAPLLDARRSTSGSIHGISKRSLKCATITAQATRRAA